MWENLVGRSRAFCEYFLPLLRKHLNGSFDALEVPDLYRNVNQVRLSLIRIEADGLVEVEGPGRLGQAPDRTFITLDFRIRRRWSLATTVGDQGGTSVDAIWRHRY